MAEKNPKSSLKKTQRIISQLKEKLKKLEIRPCRGDADMIKKDEDILLLRNKIHELEKELNQFAFFISGTGSNKHAIRIHSLTDISEPTH